MRRRDRVSPGLASLMLALSLLAHCGLVLGQEADLEACSTPLLRIDDYEPRELELVVEDSITIGDVQLKLHWPGAKLDNLRLTSPEGTEIQIDKGFSQDWPPRRIVQDGITCTFSDYGADYGTVPNTCRCLINPLDEFTLPSSQGGGLSAAGAFADFVDEEAEGTWVLVADQLDAEDVVLEEWCLRFFSERRALPVSDLACTLTSDRELLVSWVNLEDYDEIEIHLNGELEEVVAGSFEADDESEYTVESPPSPSFVLVTVVPHIDASGDGHPSSCHAAIFGEVVEEECSDPSASFGLDDPANDTIELSSDDPIVDLQVDVALAGLTSSSERYEVWLTSPAGTEVRLQYQCNGSLFGDDCGKTTSEGPLEDFDVTYWELGRAAGAPFGVGDVLRPAPDRLSDLYGEPPEGEWTLAVERRFFGCDECTLEEWCLRLLSDTPTLPVSNLSCEAGSEDGTFELNWTNTSDYDEIRIFINDELDTVLEEDFPEGSEAGWKIEVDPYPSIAHICVRGLTDGAGGTADCCDVITPALGSLSCESADGSHEIALKWASFIQFESINIHLDDELVAELPGDSESYAIPEVFGPRNAVVRIEGLLDGASLVRECVVPVMENPRLENCDRAELELMGGAIESLELGILEEFTVGDTEVVTSFTGSGVWGLHVTLESPSGSLVTLLSSDRPWNETPSSIFSDLGDPVGTVPLDCACLVAPEGPGELSDLNGTLSAGDWTLHVRNDYTYPVAVTLEEWCLRLHEHDSELITGLECSEEGEGLRLEWETSLVDGYEVLRSGQILATLAATESSYLDESPPASVLEYRVVGIVAEEARLGSDRCVIPFGAEESCESGSGLVPDGTEVELAPPLDGLVGQVEVGVVYSSPTRFVGNNIELTSPSGTTVVLLSRTFNRPMDFDVTYSTGGALFDTSWGFYSQRLRTELPGLLEEFEGESSFLGDTWSVSIDVGSDAATFEEVCLTLFPEDCDLNSPTALECSEDGGSFSIEWEHAGDSTGFLVYMNGVLVAEVGPAESSAEVDVSSTGVHSFRVEAVSGDCSSSSALCYVSIGQSEECEAPAESVGPGEEITSELSVDSELLVRDVEVVVEAAGETDVLTLSLESPDGTTVVMHDRNADGAIEVTFSDRGTPNTLFSALDLSCDLCRVQPFGPGRFEDLRGEPVDGTWSLTAANSGDAGNVEIFAWCLSWFGVPDSAPVTRLACESSIAGVSLAWDSSAMYEEFIVRRDAVPIAVLGGDDDGYLDESIPPGRYEYEVLGVDEGLVANGARCVIQHGNHQICSQLLSGDAVGFVVDQQSFNQRFEIAETFLQLECASVSPNYEISFESPMGTQVVLAVDLDAFDPYDRPELIDVVFSANGVPYSPSGLAPGRLVQVLGPGSMGDFVGEPSAEFSGWKLRAKGLDEIEWCVELYPSEYLVVENDFRRGDVDGNGVTFPILDALYLLTYGFTDGAPPNCMDAADIDDSGDVFAILDALALLEWGFVGGSEPPLPGPSECGVDPTADDLGCLGVSCP